MSRRTRFTRRVAGLVRGLALAASQWQCDQCRTWFESDTPSQRCPAHR